MHAEHACTAKGSSASSSPSDETLDEISLLVLELLGLGEGLISHVPNASIMAMT